MGDLNELCWFHQRQYKNGKQWVLPVSDYTKENGTLIEHVYYSIPSTYIQASLVPTYFSYNKAISMQFDEADKT